MTCPCPVGELLLSEINTIFRVCIFRQQDVYQKSASEKRRRQLEKTLTNYPGLSKNIQAEIPCVQQQENGDFLRNVLLAVTETELFIGQQRGQPEGHVNSDSDSPEIDLIYSSRLTEIRFFFTDCDCRKFAVCTRLGNVWYFSMSPNQQGSDDLWTKWQKATSPFGLQSWTLDKEDAVDLLRSRGPFEKRKKPSDVMFIMRQSCLCCVRCIGTQHPHVEDSEDKYAEHVRHLAYGVLCSLSTTSSKDIVLQKLRRQRLKSSDSDLSLHERKGIPGQRSTRVRSSMSDSALNGSNGFVQDGGLHYKYVILSFLSEALPTEPQRAVDIALIKYSKWNLSKTTLKHLHKIWKIRNQERLLKESGRQENYDTDESITDLFEEYKKTSHAERVRNRWRQAAGLKNKEQRAENFKKVGDQARRWLFGASPVEFGDQLTQFHADVFKRLSEIDILVFFNKHQKGETSVLQQALDFSRDISFFVVRQIIVGTTEREKLSRIKFFVQVCMACLDMNDLQSAWTIFSGLQLLPVAMLLEVWTRLHRQHYTVYRNYLGLCRMYSQMGSPSYALTLQKVSRRPPYIPWFNHLLWHLHRRTLVEHKLAASVDNKRHSLLKSHRKPNSAEAPKKKLKFSFRKSNKEESSPAAVEEPTGHAQSSSGMGVFAETLANTIVKDAIEDHVYGKLPELPKPEETQIGVFDEKEKVSDRHVSKQASQPSVTSRDPKKKHDIEKGQENKKTKQKKSGKKEKETKDKKDKKDKKEKGKKSIFKSILSSRKKKSSAQAKQEVEKIAHPVEAKKETHAYMPKVLATSYGDLMHRHEDHTHSLEQEIKKDSDIKRPVPIEPFYGRRQDRQMSMFEAANQDMDFVQRKEGIIDKAVKTQLSSSRRESTFETLFHDSDTHIPVTRPSLAQSSNKNASGHSMSKVTDPDKLQKRVLLAKTSSSSTKRTSGHSGTEDENLSKENNMAVKLRQSKHRDRNASAQPSKDQSRITKSVGAMDQFRVDETRNSSDLPPRAKPSRSQKKQFMFTQNKQHFEPRNGGYGLERYQRETGPNAVRKFHDCTKPISYGPLWRTSSTDFGSKCKRDDPSRTGHALYSELDYFRNVFWEGNSNWSNSPGLCSVCNLTGCVFESCGLEKIVEIQFGLLRYRLQTNKKLQELLKESCHDVDLCHIIQESKQNQN